MMTANLVTCLINALIGQVESAQNHLSGGPTYRELATYIGGVPELNEF
jgi:hypothetical protein